MKGGTGRKRMQTRIKDRQYYLGACWSLLAVLYGKGDGID